MRSPMPVWSAALLALSACTGAPPPPAPPPEGREETRDIRNTEAIGVPGEHLADRIDASLDAAEAHDQRLHEAAGDGEDDEEEAPAE